MKDEPEQPVLFFNPPTLFCYSISCWFIRAIMLLHRETLNWFQLDSSPECKMTLIFFLQSNLDLFNVKPPRVNDLWTMCVWTPFDVFVRWQDTGRPGKRKDFLLAVSRMWFPFLFPHTAQKHVAKLIGEIRFPLGVPTRMHRRVHCSACCKPG